MRPFARHATTPMPTTKLSAKTSGARRMENRAKRESWASVKGLIKDQKRVGTAREARWPPSQFGFGSLNGFEAHLANGHRHRITTACRR